MTPFSFFIDENSSPDVALALSREGYYSTSARDRGMLGDDDWDILSWCFGEGMVACTADADDFEEQHRQWQRRGDVHCGVLILGGSWSPEESYFAILQYAKTHSPNDVLNAIEAIPLATPEFVDQSTAAGRGFRVAV